MKGINAGDVAFLNPIIGRIDYIKRKRVSGWSWNIDDPLTWCLWSVWRTERRQSLYVGSFLLLLLLCFYPFLPFLPSFPSPFLLISLSSSSVLVIHRVEALQLDLTESLNHGTCHNSFPSLSPRHPPEHDLTEAVWSLICFPLIRRESGWISPLQASRTRQPSDP